MKREKTRIMFDWNWGISVTLWFSIYMDVEINI